MKELQLVLAILISLNIGASSAAAASATAVAGNILTTRLSLCIASICLILGASFAGHAVTTTLGRELITSSFSPQQAFIALLVIAGLLWTTFICKLPVSTSQVTTGALIGAGIMSQAVNWTIASRILGSWLVMIMAAFILSLLLHKALYKPITNLLSHSPAMKRGLAVLTITCICYLAFAAGASNAANAASPIVLAGTLSAVPATIISGVILGIGAIMGKRLLPAISTDISTMCLVSSSLAAISTATILLTGSILGIPCSLVQLTAASITASRCITVIHPTPHIRKLAAGWSLSIIGSTTVTAVLLTLFPIL